MAITNTQGNFYKPFAGNWNDATPPKIQVLQTAVAGSTMGVFKILPTATVLDNVQLFSLNISIKDATAGAQVDVMAGVNTIGAIYTGATATITSQNLRPTNFNFGPFGLMIGSTATASCELNIVTGTATVIAVATFGRAI